MGTKLLFLKLVDLLLFSFLVKSQAGVDRLEEKKGYFVTSPQEYLWIFLLNLKLGISLDQKRQDSFVRAIFCIWQAAWSMKRYYKEQPNRRRDVNSANLLHRPIRWFRTQLEEGDTKGWVYLRVYQYMRDFTNEIQKSDLPPKSKQFIKQLLEAAVVEAHQKIQDFMRQDFHSYDWQTMLHWYELTYKVVVNTSCILYLTYADIDQNDPRWNQALNFMQKLTIIGVAHDDISDIRSDIGPDGKLREPNLFFAFLNPLERSSLQSRYTGHYEFTSLNDAQKQYPRAYRQFWKFMKEQMRLLDMIPGVNLHELLEFYLFHFPEYFMKPISADHNRTESIRLKSLDSVVSSQKNMDLIKQFRFQITQEKHIDQAIFAKRYLDLVKYLYAQSLTQSGLSLHKVSHYLEKPISTLSHWMHEERVPLSLRSKKKELHWDNPTLYFLLGVFAFKGSVDQFSMKLVHKSKAVLTILKERMRLENDCIFQTSSGYYLRYYHKARASQILTLKENIGSTLEGASLPEQDQFREGLLLIQRQATLVRIPSHGLAKTTQKVILQSLERKWGGARLSIRGNYIEIRDIHSKNRLNEAQHKSQWDRYMAHDPHAMNELIDQYQSYGKKVIRMFFGNQSSEFWSELPTLMYICLREGLEKYREKGKPETELKSFLKYHTLTFFRNHFRAKAKENTTHLSEEGDVTEVADPNTIKEDSISVDILRKGLEQLKVQDFEAYGVIALRYGYVDGTEHVSTDLVQRAFEMGVHQRDGTPYSSSQIKRIIEKGMKILRHF